MTADRSSMTNFSRCYWRKWRIKPRAAACSLPLRPRERMSWAPNSQVCHHEHCSADHPTCPFRILRGNQMHLVRRLRQLWHMVGREVFVGELKLHPWQVCLCYDVGCHGNGSDKIQGYRFHGLHGRVIPFAAGAKLANMKVPVIAFGGDGATFSEGVAHLVHAVRSNYPITFVL